MLGTVDLHQLAIGFSAQPRLMERAALLARHRQAVALGQLLGASVGPKSV
jgi:hypothetical protein